LFYNESDESGVSLEMRRFRQHVQNSLNRDYYDHKTCLWMLPAVVLACLQILVVTVLVFLDLSDQGTSAALVLANYSLIIFLVSPSACFIYIRMSLSFEYRYPDPRRWHAWIYWTLMLLIFVLYGLYPVWYVMYGPGGVIIASFSKSVDVIIVGISMVILSLGVYSTAFITLFR
jgi:hypothetical protein